VVGVGIGAVFGLGASSKWSDAKSNCTAYPYGCSQDALDAKSSAQSKASVATVAFIVGGAAIAGAAVLWFTAGPSKENSVAVGVGLPAELEPVLEPERIVTGTAWTVTEPDPCVDARAGALTRA